MSLTRKNLGRTGESLAAEFLLQKDYKKLAQNVRTRFGEIDLVMESGDEVVLVEVKTQTNAAVDPVYKINPLKQLKLIRLAQYLSLRYPDRNIRIDAVTLYWTPDSAAPIITHYQNITQL